MGLFGDVVRGLGDVATFGGNELLGNPLGKFANEVVDPATPVDPNAAANAQSYALAQQNIQLQEDFAKNGISWRVADAAKNGISPLAALGASEPAFSPVGAVFNSSAPVPTLAHDLLSAGAVSMGQNLSRSLVAQSPAVDKANAALDLAYKSKQVELLDTQIALAKKNLVTQPGTPPGLPAWTTVQNRDGTTSVVPSADASQASHGEVFGPLLWQIHNGLIPSVQDLYFNLIQSGAYGSQSDGNTVNSNYR